MRLDALIVSRAAHEEAQRDLSPYGAPQLVWDALEAARMRMALLEELPPIAVELGAFYQCAAALRGEYSWSDPFLTRAEHIPWVRRGAERLGADEFAAAVAGVEARLAAEPHILPAFRAGRVGEADELEAGERILWAPLEAAATALPYPEPLAALARAEVPFDIAPDGDAVRSRWAEIVAAMPDYTARIEAHRRYGFWAPNVADLLAATGRRLVEYVFYWTPDHEAVDPGDAYPVVFAQLADVTVRELHVLHVVEGARAVVDDGAAWRMFDLRSGGALGEWPKKTSN